MLIIREIVLDAAIIDPPSMRYKMKIRMKRSTKKRLHIFID
jgi:hypothetical protein